MKKIISIILLISLCMCQMVYAKVEISFDYGNNVAETQAPKKQEQVDTAKSQQQIAEQQAQQKAQAEAIARQQAENQALLEQYIQQNYSAYTDSNGIKRGWEFNQQLGGWVFYNMLGNMVKNDWVEWNNQKYYMNENYLMAVGWKKLGGKWYYFNKNGDMHLGWLQEGQDWYYLDPIQGGMMATADAYIDGEMCRFTMDGKWVEDTDNFGVSDIAGQIMTLVKYVDDSHKLKEVSTTRERKDEIKKIIYSLPRDILLRMLESVKAIYICEQDRDGFIKEQNYRDTDETGATGETERVQLPFNYQGHCIYMCGNSLNLYNGIGNFIVEVYRIQEKKLYGTSTWKTIYQNYEEKDSAYSLSINDYRVYPETIDSCLASCIGFYLISRFELQETCPLIYKYIATYCNIGVGASSPLTE